MTIKVDMRPRTVAISMLVIIAFVAGLLAINQAKHSLVLLALSAFLALALNAPVNWLTRFMPKRSRILSTLLAYLIVIAIIAGFAWVSIPPLINQSQKLANNFPAYIDDMKDKSRSLADFINEHKLEKQADEFVDSMTSHIGGYGDNAFDALKSVVGGVVSIITIFVLVFLMLIDGPRLIAAYWRTYVNEDKLARHKDLAIKMYRVVTGYVNGQVIIATIDAVAALIIMIILHQPYALPLAALIWLTGLIPLVGATIGAVIVVIIAFFHSPINALILAIYFPIYQLIENHSIQPYIQSRTLDMSPLIVFSAVVIGVSFGGLLAGFLALPVAGCIQVLIVDYYKRKNNINILSGAAIDKKSKSPKVKAK